MSYMPNSPDYEDLCLTVEKVNAEAAAYLRGPARELTSFNPTANLGNCFTWSHTPQGHNFWYLLYRTLPEVKPRPRYYADGLPY